MEHNFISPFNHKIKKKIVKFSISKLRLKGYKIAHISDIHLGYYLGEEFLDKLVTNIIDIRPNICVITGDLIADNRDFSINILSPLKRLTEEIDTYFVLGNHEIRLYRYKTEEFLKELRKLGLYTLHNQSTIIKYGEDKFNLVGIGEKIGKDYNMPINIDSSFKNIDKKLETIVLVHRPNTVREIKNHNFVLALSGHNHGGQITKLGLLSPILRNEWRYLNGKISLGEDKFIYITSGVGYSRLPIRLFAPSEIAIIEIN